MALCEVTMTFIVKQGTKQCRREADLLLDKLSDRIASSRAVALQEDGSVVNIEIEEAEQ